MDIEKVIEMVMVFHGNQKYGDLPFIVHPLLVARHFEDTLRQTVALLHDVVEDTDITVDDIRFEFGDEIASAVDSISKRDGEDYGDYIERVAKNFIAKEVKIADLQENLHSCKFYYNNRYAKLIPRYEKALKFLTNLK